MSKWYKIKASGSESAKLTIFGDIGENWWGDGVTGKKISEELAALNVPVINVELDTYGGSVSDGIHIYNALKRHAAHINIDVLGVAVSSGSLIAMAADTLRMGSTTQMMIHAPWTWADGNAKELREQADVLDSYSEAMANAYAKKAGFSYEDALALLTDGQDHWYTADEAVEAGFADEIYDSMPVAAHGAGLKRFKPPAAAAALIKPEKEVNPMAKDANKEAASPEKPVVAEAPKVAASQKTEADIRAEMQRDETTRRSEVTAAFDLVKNTDGLGDLRAECLTDMNVTADAARQKILAKMGEGIEPIAGQSSVKVVHDQHDKFREGAVEAILARHGHKGVKAENNEFRGMTLTEMAKESMRMAGDDVRGMRPLDVVAAAFTQSTSDFPVILENAMHKVLLDAYGTAPDRWSQFCKVGSVSDFREWNRYRTGTIGNLDALSETGEYQHKALSDAERSKVQASTKGNLVNISREMIINDDMGGFLDIMNSMGRAAKRTIEADVFAALVANGALSDGVAMFHADHKNKASSGSVISVASLDAARVAMAGQKDKDGNDYLDIMPDILLVPTAMGALARTTVNAQYDPDTANKLQKPNAVNGIVSDIIDTPRLAGNGWYMLAAPGDAPVMEVVFLNGEQEPFLDQKDGWNRDGTEFKVRLDYGVAGIDYRGGYFNPGA